MLRLRAVAAALLLGAPFAASAADITRIASSFDDDDPFDLIVDVDFERTQSREKIVREQAPLSPDQSFQEVPELWHKGTDSRLNLKLAIGLYRDLEFSFGVPLILQQSDNYDFVSGTNAGNSSVIKNCVNPDGSVTKPSCATDGTGERGLFGVDRTITSKRGGLGNMHFGLAYAFFNQQRDDTKPTWIVGLDYEAPTAKLRDPSQDNTGDESGNVGDRVHKYTFYTSFSRKMGVAEPYFKVHYTAPVQGPGFYTNCSNRELLGRPDNCGTGPWTRKETGIHSPKVGGFVFGTEFTAFDDKTKNQKLALDLRTIGTYVSEGRYYNELSAGLKKLLASQDYFQVGGQVGATASAGEAFTLRASGTFLYNTDHTITNESIGKDLDGMCREGENYPCVVPNDPGVDQPEVNPNFDFRTDLVSRRFRATESKTFRVDLSASFAF